MRVDYMALARDALRRHQTARRPSMSEVRAMVEDQVGRRLGEKEWGDLQRILLVFPASEVEFVPKEASE